MIDTIEQVIGENPSGLLVVGLQEELAR